MFTPENISNEALHRLKHAFDGVFPVETLEGKSLANLDIIGRPDLAATMTKLHLWNLTQYDRILYLDADTLVVNNVDHLFELPLEIDFAASPELGFPDCFNSGVMLLKPSSVVFKKLCQHALTVESFDGGDQGLLNTFFGDGSRGHESEILHLNSNDLSAANRKTWFRLSFTYNMEMHKVYRLYIPAAMRYQDQHHILHFIGKQKPWHFEDGHISLEDNAGAYDEFYANMVKRWWGVERLLCDEERKS